MKLLELNSESTTIPSKPASPTRAIFISAKGFSNNLLFLISLILPGRSVNITSPFGKKSMDQGISRFEAIISIFAGSLIVLLTSIVLTSFIPVQAKIKKASNNKI